MIRMGCVVFMSALGLAACSSSFDDICTKQTSCIGGNDKDKQACIDEAGAQKKSASDYGCSSQFDTWSSCVDSTFVCMGGQVSSSCSTQQAALDMCTAAASGENKNQPGH